MTEILDEIESATNQQELDILKEGLDGRSKEMKAIRMKEEELGLSKPVTHPKATVQDIKRHINIKPSQFQPITHSVQRVEVIAEPGQTLEDFLNPRAWATVAQQVRPWALIDVISEDGLFYARLFVKSTTRQTVHVEVLLHKEMDKATKEREYSDYKVEYLGQVKKWCVVRKEDNSTISDGNEAQEDAMRELAQYEKVING